MVKSLNGMTVRPLNISEAIIKKNDEIVRGEILRIIKEELCLYLLLNRIQSSLYKKSCHKYAFMITCR